MIILCGIVLGLVIIAHGDSLGADPDPSGGGIDIFIGWMTRLFGQMILAVVGVWALITMIPVLIMALTGRAQENSAELESAKADTDVQNPSERGGSQPE